MKKILHILLVCALLIAGAQSPLQARQGDSCEDPIELTPTYSQRIMQEGSFWYIANTFDLPMAIAFHPAVQTAEAPKLELDFSCTPGVYDDPVICSIFCNTRPAYVSLPYEEIPPKSYDEDGKVVYRIAFGSAYRDMLFSAGIDYNVPVYIHATFHCGGTLEMEQNAFNNCMDGPKFMHLGDTVRVAAKDSNRHVIVPYIQWRYDSIRYVWQGKEPCIFAVSNVCDFNPTNANDGRIIDGGPDHPIQPGGEFRVSSELLKAYVSDQKHYPNEAGMYFAKFYSEEPGIMTIERIPAPTPGCDATLMRLGESTSLERNDTNAVFAIPSSWNESMQFTSPTSHVLKMYVGAKCDFLLSEAIAVYQYDRIENGHQLDMFEADMKSLWQHKLKSENYLYIRFECSDKTTVRPALWTPSGCEQNTQRIQKGKKETIAKQSRVVYSLYYPDWKGGDMKLYWESNQAGCSVFIADTCQVPNQAKAPVFYTETIGQRATLTIPQATVDSWESKTDPDGYLYIRFYSQAKSAITVSTTAPEEEDNPCPTIDSISEIVAWDSCFWHGQMYYKGGRYSAYGTLDEETGCYDSIFTLNLMIRNTTYDTIRETGCDSIVYRNRVYRESGVYRDTISQTGGHRLIVLLDMTIPHSTASSLTIRQYEPYTTVSGKVLTETGVYRDTILNNAGCDSVITYNLTIYKTEYTLVEQTGCDSLIIDKVRYTQSGNYVDTLLQPGGDRIIRTLRLTIGHSTYATENPSACDSYTSPRGVVYTKSGDYTEKLTNAEGCDSIITLHVTVGKTSYGEETVTGCERYTSPWGKVYTESGTYTETGVNKAGCDSIVTLYLTIIPDCRTYDTVYFCRGFNTEHEEMIGDNHVRRYLPYVYESPAAMMSEVIVHATKASEATQTLLDLKGAEAELRAYYTGPRTMIETVVWSLRENGSGAYVPVAVGATPQWVKAGKLAVQIRFCCGELYNDEYPTAVEDISAEDAQPVKRIVNGQIIIIRGNAAYTPFGQRIQ